LFWRLYFKERIQKNIKVNDLPKENLHGKDSEFYSIVSKLNEMGHYKYQGETLYKWLNRISKNVDISRILPALELHYRYRFDPDGIDADSRDDLDKMVSNSLSSLG
jgi:hypothetical protein